MRYFLAVIDHGSINAAASAVGVAPPTISQALRGLERDLRTPLFHRIGRGMVPTSAGYALVAPARRILRDVTHAGGSVPDDQGNLRGHLEIRSHPAVSVGVLPRLVAEFRGRHPLVTLSIGNLGDEEPVAALLQNAVCELVLTHFPFDRGRDDDAPELEMLELGSQEYWVAYPADAEAPPDDPMSWDQLDTEMVVVPHGGAHSGRILRMMPERQRTRPAAVTLQNREARLAFGVAGVGATWIEQSLAPIARARGLQVRALDPALPAPYGLVYEAAGRSAAADAFLELARCYVDGGDADPSASATARNATAAGES